MIFHILRIVILFFYCSLPAQAFTLKNGDLIFQEAYAGDFNNAIKGVTYGINSYSFTHVGIVYIDDKDEVFVIEATQPKVCQTRLQDYLCPQDKTERKPFSVVGRLKSQYQYLIPQALEEAKALLGKDYDDAFDLKNDKYYCSELVYFIFFKANNNNSVFPLNIMTFKEKESGLFLPEWVDHFRKVGISIPEGELGINPGAMSRSEVINIVYSYDDNFN